MYLTGRLAHGMDEFWATGLGTKSGWQRFDRSCEMAFCWREAARIGGCGVQRIGHIKLVLKGVVYNWGSGEFAEFDGEYDCKGEG